MVDQDSVMKRRLVRTWFDRAQIDYSDLYVRLYVSYNAWYRKVTATNIDAEAIKRLTGRFVIWDDYLNGRTLSELRPMAKKVSDYTEKYPHRPVPSVWDGRVTDCFDWKGLIYFWYQVRCDLFHGDSMPGIVRHDEAVKLAYDSLNCFMTEIIKRMRHCFTETDYAQLVEVKRLLVSDEGPSASLRVIERRLQQKFIRSPDIWNVDMQRV